MKKHDIREMIETGNDALFAFDFDKAEKIFTKVRKEDQTIGDLWLSRVYAGMGKMDMAFSSLQKVMKSDDENARQVAVVELGSLYIGMNKPEQALKILEDVKENAVDDVRQMIALCYMMLGKSDEAEHIALKSIAMKEDGGWALLGEIYAYQDKWKEAYDQFLRAYSEDRKQAFNVSKALLHLERYSEAIPYLKEALRQGKCQIVSRNLAFAFLKNEQFKNALNMALYAKSIGAEDTEVILAHIYQELGDLKKALEYYNMLLKKEVRPNNIYTLIGQCYLGMGMLDEALASLKKAVKNHERGVWYNYGFVHKTKGRTALAIRYFKKSIEIDKDSALLASYELGMLYRKIGEKETALQYFQDAWSGGYLPGGVALGDCSFSDGDYKQASKWYQKALDNGYSDALYPLAHAHRLMENYNKARTMFQQCIDGGDRRGTLGLALVAEEEGDMDGAEVFYESGVEQDLIGVNSSYGRFKLRRGDYFTAAIYLEKAWTVDGDTSVLPDLVKVYFKADPPVYNRKKIHKYMQLCKKHQIPIGDLDDSDDGETADNGTDVGEK
ncbi:MAG: tetratricopeptide repeat protein [Victivallales bacterium]|nr:tetratricopeptide repeat protein [Victivallales bacterium]